MGIMIPDAPSGWQNAVDREVDLFVDDPQEPTAMAHETIGDIASPRQLKKLEVSRPMAVYEVAVREGRYLGLNAASQRCWNCIVYIAGNPKASIDLARIGGAQWTLLCSYHGDVLDELVNGLKRAGEIAEGELGRYELRILRIPSLFWGLIWLSNADNPAVEDDLFTPLVTMHGLEAGGRYAAAEVDRLLKEVAAQYSAREEELLAEEGHG